MKCHRSVSEALRVRFWDLANVAFVLFAPVCSARPLVEAP